MVSNNVITTQPNLNAYASFPTELVQSMLDGCTEDQSDLKELLQTIIKAREAEAQKTLLLEEFEASILELVDMLPQPPDGLYNILLAYRDVTEDDTTKPAELVEVDGEQIERYPQITVRKWVPTRNHVCYGTAKTALNAQNGPGSKKRAVTVKKINGDVLDTIGNFRSGKEACVHLGISTLGDSANRKLEGNGYVLVQYSGNDFIVKE